MKDEILTLLIAVVSSGFLSVLIDYVRNRHKDRAEAQLITEQAETQDAEQQKSRQDIIAGWERRYGELVRRLDSERAIRENMQNSTAGIIQEINHTLETEREARISSEKRAQGQADLLIQLQKQLGDLKAAVSELNTENEQLKMQVTAMQSVIDEQAAMIARLKRELMERDAEIVSLKKRHAVERARQAVTNSPP